jgi:hypothetical protein
MQSATAAEILFDSLLGMLLWEANIAADNEGIEIAVSELSFNLVKRVRQCIHPKLGGVWRTEGPGVVAAWYSKLRRRGTVWFTGVIGRCRLRPKHHFMR